MAISPLGADARNFSGANVRAELSAADRAWGRYLIRKRRHSVAYNAGALKGGATWKTSQGACIDHHRLHKIPGAFVGAPRSGVLHLPSPSSALAALDRRAAECTPAAYPPDTVLQTSTSTARANHVLWGVGVASAPRRASAPVLRASTDAATAAAAWDNGLSCLS